MWVVRSSFRGGLADEELGAQCGKCPESWDPVSKCQSSDSADIRVMRTAVYGGFGSGKFPAD